MTQVKLRNGWRMSCDVGEAAERLENELFCQETFQHTNKRLFHISPRFPVNENHFHFFLQRQSVHFNPRIRCTECKHQILNKLNGVEVVHRLSLILPRVQPRLEGGCKYTKDRYKKTVMLESKQNNVNNVSFPPCLLLCWTVFQSCFCIFAEKQDL